MYFILTYLHSKSGGQFLLTVYNVIYCHHLSHLTSLTVHAVQAKDETDEALQRHVSRGGPVAQSHQIEHVIADTDSC